MFRYAERPKRLWEEDVGELLFRPLAGFAFDGPDISHANVPESWGCSIDYEFHYFRPKRCCEHRRLERYRGHRLPRNSDTT